MVTTTQVVFYLHKALALSDTRIGQVLWYHKSLLWLYGQGLHTTSS